jgi:SAM-dependent methyltransferase
MGWMVKSLKEETLAHFEVLASSGYWESLYSNSYNFITRREEVINMVSDLDYSSVLDLGCGTGDYADYFLKNQKDYLGIDNSGKMIRRAQTRFPDALFQVDDVENSSLPSEKFDLVLAVGLIEYFPEPDRLIREIHRIVNKRGYFLAQAPHLSCVQRINRITYALLVFLITIYNHFKKRSPLHQAFYTESSLRSLIEPYGFVHCATSYCNYRLIPSPFSRLSRKLEERISKKITKAKSREKYKYLASNIIVLFQKT